MNMSKFKFIILILIIFSFVFSETNYLKVKCILPYKKDIQSEYAAAMTAGFLYLTRHNPIYSGYLFLFGGTLLPVIQGRFDLSYPKIIDQLLYTGGSLYLIDLQNKSYRENTMTNVAVGTVVLTEVVHIYKENDQENDRANYLLTSSVFDSRDFDKSWLIGEKIFKNLKVRGYIETSKKDSRYADFTKKLLVIKDVNNVVLDQEIEKYVDWTKYVLRQLLIYKEIGKNENIIWE
jgi:hypothetical protein